MSLYLMVLASLASAVAVAGEQPTAKYQVCVACHGAQGEGNPALSAPALAGQDSAYLQRQLHHFRNGVRGSDPKDVEGTQMRPMAATMAEEDIVLVSDWLASLPAAAVAPVEGADFMNGNNFYQAKCGACHGGKAQGNPGLNAPALAFLDAGYLKRQLVKFQQGLRGSHPKDKFGRQMKMMSTALPTDKDVDDVIAFINVQSAAQ